MCSGLTAYAALKRLASRSGRAPLLLVGVGGVGMMGLALTHAMYGTAPFVADIDPKKREAALAAGAREAFDPADANVRKAVLKASGGIYAAVDFVGSDKSLNFATSTLAKGGKVVVTGLIGGGYSMAVAMFPLKAMTIEGTHTGTLKEARELVDVVRDKNIAPPPIEERPLAAAQKSLEDLRGGRVVGRVVLTA
jgi:D-arabinose 1-dehydrogenase-like Zn-dependent alcohol dehydrogenase